MTTLELLTHRLQLQNYIEAPRLLDPHLEKICSTLMGQARILVEKGLDPSVSLFKVIYTLTKVRKAKVVGMQTVQNPV
jgi:hypothetical protein